MDDTLQTRPEDKCILAYKHTGANTRTLRLIVDFRQVPLGYIRKLYTVNNQAVEGKASWLIAFRWLKKALMNDAVGQSNCTAVHQSEKPLALELVIDRNYMNQAMLDVVAFLAPYGIQCELVKP